MSFSNLMESAEITRSGNISKQATKFLEQSFGAKWETADLSLTGVKILRQENSEVAAPGCKTVQEELQFTTKEEELDKVKVHWVIPKHVKGTEVILYIFGGAFVCGSPEDDLSISGRLADWTGRKICAPRYRLAPEHCFPAAANDVFSVYKNLIRQSNVIVVGESAGGNLAVGLILKVISNNLPTPLAAGLLSPWLDLTHSGKSHELTDLDPTLSIEHFLNPASKLYIGESHTPSSPPISPLFADIPASFPPTTISTATRDLLYSDSSRFADKLREQNVLVDLQVSNGLWHVFEWYPELPEAEESLRHIASFLSKYLVSNPRE